MSKNTKLSILDDWYDLMFNFYIRRELGRYGPVQFQKNKDKIELRIDSEGIDPIEVDKTTNRAQKRAYNYLKSSKNGKRR